MKRHDITGKPGNGNRNAVMPEKEARKKQRDFFGLWSTVMEACGDNVDDAPFDELCDEIFKNEYHDGKEAVEWLKAETAKIHDKKVSENVMMAVGELVDQSKYFYLAVGFGLARDYDVSGPEAREQIEYLRERIREAGLFPLIARRM